MALTVLPRFFVMHHGEVPGKYLTVPEKLPSSLPSGFLKITEESIWSPRVKFALEPSSEDDTLVHIRCCYTNKYWLVHDMGTQSWLVASANKPEEDPTNPACTLFRPTRDTNGFRLESIAKGTQPSPNVASGDEQYGILMSQSSSVFLARDWESLVKLPSQVAFRAETLDGKYLCARTVDGIPRLMLESGWDVGEPVVAHELFPNNHGNYRIKSTRADKFWKRNPQAGYNWILTNANDNDNSGDTLFSIVKISDTLIAIRSLANTYYCGHSTPLESLKDALNARYLTMSDPTKLIVEERVLERNISDIRYRLSDSRIYQEEIQQLSHAIARNDSPNKETTITVTYSSSESRTTSWSNSISVNLGVKASFKPSVIPLIEKGHIKLSEVVGQERQWGKEETTEIPKEASYVAVVPPLTAMKVTLMCTKAACDVPFSYAQYDLLTTGERVTTVYDDGVFTGINSYNFYFETSKVDFSF